MPTFNKIIVLHNTIRALLWLILIGFFVIVKILIMKVKFTFNFVMLLFFSMSSMYAQRAITGTVTDAENEALIGVNIIEQGTTNGTVSDLDGSFILEVSEGATLVFSYTGFSQQTIEVGDQTNLAVIMEEGVSLNEVVVTALGIEREEKALGYSVSEVKGEELTIARENNVINQLSGKVAGVVVNNSATGPAGSSRVVIRGSTSLDPNSNNQPLYVIDGIPIDNTNLGAAGMWGGLDLGNGTSSINQDDIETMSVLKGPAAAALYGTRAQNGVILITTKKGTKSSAIGVEFNTNYTIEKPLDFYSDIQEVYGFGNEGLKPETADEAILATRSNWGALLDGSPAIQFDGSTAPYSRLGDAYDKIYDNGQTFTNSLALSGGGENATFRISAADLRNNGLFQNVGYDKNTITARGSGNLGQGLINIDAKVSYINERADNRPALSDSPHNPGHLNEVAHGVNLDLLRNTDPVTGEYYPLYSGSVFRVNPFFGVNQQHNGDTRDRLQGFASAKLNVTDWLSIMARAGTDFYTFRQTTWDGEMTPHLSRAGRIAENEYRIRENNYDFLITANKDITQDFSLGVNLGGSQYRRTYEFLRNSGDEFVVYGLRTLTNTNFPGRGYDYTEKEINSLYGSAQLGYKNYLYLDLTARNDWSSTLPLDNNSYFYPSASLSFILTDAFNISRTALSFAKTRFSWAQVGGDTDPYRLALTYSVVGQPHLGYPQGQISQSQIPLATLKPTLTTSIEAGLDLRFFDGRAGIDFTYYNASTEDQILATTISSTSGFSSVIVNAGEITNKGVELLISGNPIRTQSGFNWDVSFNYARNRNEVKSLDADGKLESLRLGESRQRNAFVEARLGQPYGAIVGRAYKRDASGNIVYSEDGLPIQGDLETLGVGVPDWTGGLSNTFTYKGISFGALIDFRFGGVIHSMTNLSLIRTGKHAETVEGRAEWAESEAARIAAGATEDEWTPTGGLRIQGVTENGEALDRFVDPEVYWGTVASRIAEEFVYSADFIKVRQVTLGYSLPKKWLNKSPVQSAAVSFVARNLFFINKDTPNIDPEAVYNSTNAGQGLEYATIPTTRSYGINLNLKF